MKAYHVMMVFVFVWIIGVLVLSLDAGTVGVDDVDHGGILEIRDPGDRGWVGNLIPSFIYEFASIVISPIGAFMTVITFNFGGTVLPSMLAGLFTLGFSWLFLWMVINFVRGGGNA